MLADVDICNTRREVGPCRVRWARLTEWGEVFLTDKDGHLIFCDSPFRLPVVRTLTFDSMIPEEQRFPERTAYSGNRSDEDRPVQPIVELKVLNLPLHGFSRYKEVGGCYASEPF